jgi:hypothetical protein
MVKENSLNDFFVYPHVKNAEEIRSELDRLDRLQEHLPPGLSSALSDLIRAADRQRQFAYLAQHLTPFEFLLVCMLAECAHRLKMLEERSWTHPPFP